MAYEYKCVAAPERGKRRKGVKGRTERVAAAMEDIIRAEAVDGWEYMRTDLLPVEERSGWFSRPQEAHRAVLVFRRGERMLPQQSAPSLQSEEPRPAEPVLKLAAQRDVPADDGVGPAPQVAPPSGLA